MKDLTLFLLMFCFSILSSSCTKELKYSKEEIYKIAQQADPTVTFVLPRGMNEGINCAEYSPGCIAGHTVKVQNLDMIAVEFHNETEAKFAAKKVRGYYLRNWMFDDVTTEPILERFVTEKLKAKKATEDALKKD